MVHLQAALCPRNSLLLGFYRGTVGYGKCLDARKFANAQDIRSEACACCPLRFAEVRALLRRELPARVVRNVLAMFA
jgi:hypothetical protein